MPRRPPSEITEIRYEYSLGPKEQGLVEEVEKTLKYTNHAALAVGILAPVGLVGLGYGIYKASQYIAQGLSEFSLGGDVVQSIVDKTPVGIALNKAEELGVDVSEMPWYIRVSPPLAAGWIANEIRKAQS